jgi:hypothetical protein
MAKIRAGQEEMMIELEAHHERIMAKMKAQHEKRSAFIRADRGETKAYPVELEAIPEEFGSESAQEEVPKEEAAGKSFGALKKQHGDWNLAVGRRQNPKERTQDNGGSRKNLALAYRGTIRRTGVARRKGHGRQEQDQNDEVQLTLKGRTLRMRRREQQKCNNGIRDRGLKQQLYLGSKRSFNETARQIF